MQGIDDKILSVISYPFGYKEYISIKNNKLNKIILLNKKSKKVLFILPHWLSGKILYRRLINKLKNKYTIIVYRMPNKILNDDIKSTLKYFDKAKKDIIKITDYLENKGYKHFSILGVSLSGILAFIVANSDKRFKKIIFNLPGSDLAKCFWESSSLVTKLIRRKMEAGNIDFKNLENSWKNLAPVNNIQNLNKRKILIQLGKNDKVIPYKYGLELLNAMKKESIDFELDIDNFFGHYIILFKQLMFPKRIIKFLEN